MINGINGKNNRLYTGNDYIIAEYLLS